MGFLWRFPPGHMKKVGALISQKMAPGKFKKNWDRMSSRQIKNYETAADLAPGGG